MRLWIVAVMLAVGLSGCADAMARHKQCPGWPEEQMSKPANSSNGS